MTPWRRRAFGSVGLTQVPLGPHVDRLSQRLVGTIKVTSACYDDIGSVLRAMGVAFDPWDGDYVCDLLFINCGTADRLDAGEVRRFVECGGCLYASDLTSGFVSQAFPGIFDFGGTGVAGTLDAVVLDPELQTVMGPSTRIHFDMNDWSMLQSARADTLLACARGSSYGELPLMVGTQLGDGAVFYTSFHNRAQASASEQVLLQLLVLKQIGASSKISMEQASKQAGVNLMALKARIDGA